MNRIDPHTVLVDTMGLKRVMRDGDTEFVALCPFHDDHDPSLHVNVSKGVYRCFACQKSGTIIALIEETAGIDHLEACTIWIRMRGTTAAPVPAVKTIRPWSELNLIPFAKLSKGHPYLASRGIGADTCQRFDVRWDKDDQWIVVPVHTATGQLVGTVSRTLIKHKPKYMYSTDLPKSRVLFNMHRVVTRVMSSVVVTEGVMDVMRTHDAKYPWVVGTLGESVSHHQAQVLKDYAMTAWLAFDNDEHHDVFMNASALRLDELGVSWEEVKVPAHRKDLGECSNEELRACLPNPVRR